jgi:hypothetical protein
MLSSLQQQKKFATEHCAAQHMQHAQHTVTQRSDSLPGSQERVVEVKGVKNLQHPTAEPLQGHAEPKEVRGRHPVVHGRAVPGSQQRLNHLQGCELIFRVHRINKNPLSLQWHWTAACSVQ